MWGCRRSLTYIPSTIRAYWPKARKGTPLKKTVVWVISFIVASVRDADL